MDTMQTNKLHPHYCLNANALVMIALATIHFGHKPFFIWSSSIQYSYLQYFLPFQMLWWRRRQPHQIWLRVGQYVTNSQTAVCKVIISSISTHPDIIHLTLNKIWYLVGAKQITLAIEGHTVA